MVWFTYDDLKTHRLEGEYTLPDAGRKVLERCLLFLGTGLEYSGPRGFVAPDIPRERYAGSLERLLHRLRRRELPTIQSVWNARTWPFINPEQLDHAMNDASNCSISESDPPPGSSSENGLLRESPNDRSAYVPQKVWVTLSSGPAGMPYRSEPGLSSYGRDTTSNSSSNG